MGGPSRSRIGALAAIAVLALGLGACGGDDSGDSGEETTAEATTFAAEDVTAAFEEAAGGYPFEETTSLVEGATAYGPHNSADLVELEPLHEGLGESSIVWQFVVFDGTDPPLDADAAKEVAFASKKFDEIEPGVFLGDSDIAYIARGNVVINGPLLEGNPDDETLDGWKAVLDGL